MRLKVALAFITIAAALPLSAAITVTHYYRLGEADPGAVVGNVGNATTVDSTGGIDLARVGSPTYAAGVTGQANNSTISMHFPATVSYDRYQSAAPLSTATDNFGIEAWVRSDGSGSGNALIAYNGNTSSSGWGIFRFGASWGWLMGGVVGSAPAVIQPGIWTHLALIRDTGVVRFYVNGRLVQTASFAPNVPSGVFQIGSNTGGEAFDGRIDEVRTFTFAAGAFVPGDLLVACTPAPLTMVSWWRAEGNASDSWDSNNGSLVGNTTYLAGYVGQAFSFDGSGDAVDVPDSASLDLTSQLTIDAWIYRTATGNGRIVDKITAGGADGYLLDVVNGKLRLLVGPSSVSGFTTLTPGIWYHVAGTYDGTALRVYVNGAPDGMAPTSGAIPTNNLPLRIGLAQDGSNAYAGLIDETEVFNTALTQAQIEAIVNAGPNGKCTSCTPSTATPPSITCPPDVNVSIGHNGTARVNYATPSASDACSVPVVSCAPPSGSDFPIGTTLVTCTATNSFNQTSQCSFNVTVTQNTAIPLFDARTLLMIAAALIAVGLVSMRANG